MISEKISDTASILLRNSLFTPTFGERFDAAKIFVERIGVNDSDHGIESSDVRKLLLLLSRQRHLESESFSDRHRLRNTGRFDEKIVKLAFRAELGDLNKKILTKSAADASILHFDELLFDLRKLGTSLFDELGVDVDFRVYQRLRSVDAL